MAAGLAVRARSAAPPPPPPPSDETEAANDNHTITPAQRRVVRLIQGPVAGGILLAAGWVLLRSVGAI
ncbi:MAG: hypothetical protein ACXWKY_00685 [Caulobacteraceae bacterium]